MYTKEAHSLPKQASDHSPHPTQRMHYNTPHTLPPNKTHLQQQCRQQPLPLTLPSTLPNISRNNTLGAGRQCLQILPPPPPSPLAVRKSYKCGFRLVSIPVTECTHDFLPWRWRRAFDVGRDRGGGVVPAKPCCALVHRRLPRSPRDGGLPCSRGLVPYRWSSIESRLGVTAGVRLIMS